MTIRIGTWNVAAFRTLQSASKFDYARHENLDYFAHQMKGLNLDILCLQESHIHEDHSQARRVADILGMPFVVDTPGCPSHIQAGYNITTAILGKLQFSGQTYARLPQPSFDLYLHGKLVPPYDRYIQQVHIGNFTVATMHPEPLETLGMRYEFGKGKSLAKAIDLQLLKILAGPLLFAADFNMEHPLETLHETSGKFGLQEALPQRPTTPNNRQPDHILYSPEWKLIDSNIKTTKTDHYLSWAELEINY